MPALDRRIIVRRTVTTRNLFGEQVAVVMDYPLWATREDASQRDKEEAGGTLTLASRVYIVRYSSALAEVSTSELSVIDGTTTLDCTNLTEASRRGERRKFLRIEVIGEVV